MTIRLPITSAFISSWFTRMLLIALPVVIGTVAHAAGPMAYIGNFKDNTVSVVDISSGVVVATIAVAAGPHGMAVTPDGRTVYVSGDAGSSVSVIDTATDRVKSTIEVGKTPHGLALTPDGKLLAIAVYGEDKVAFVDTATGKRIGEASVAKPHTIAIRPDGSVAYASSQEPGKFALVAIDLKTKDVVRTVALDKPPRDLEFGYDGKMLYFTQAGINAIRVLDPATDKIVAEIATGASPHIANVFRGAAVGTAVVQGPGEILLFDPTTNTPLRSIAVGKQPHWIAATGDGKKVFVTNEGSNDLTEIDLASGKTATIAVGNAPRKVVVQPMSAKANTAMTNGAKPKDAMTQVAMTDGITKDNRTRDAMTKAAMSKDSITQVAMTKVAMTGEAKVAIANFAFTPETLTVRPGQAVTWANNDGAPHGLAYADGAPGIDLLLPGKTFTRTYPKTGTFDYVCSVHPYMRGRVVVAEH